MTEAVLVTGGRGTLGRAVVQRLLATGRDVRVLSRKPRPVTGSAAGTWITGDLLSNEGINDAVAGVDTIIHCASDQQNDVESARNLIAALGRNGSPHLIYISIVGVDRIPFGYYRSKLEVERLIETSELPWTILRATQFHDLIVWGCTALSRYPVMPVPSGTSFQPIDAGEVADRLVELASAAPSGRAPDIGGPQVRSCRDLAHSYLRATGRHRLVLPVRIPGATFAGFRQGGHLAPDGALGRITFEDFLARRATPAPPPKAR